MKQSQFDHLEAQAASLAGNRGGEYLDEIGKTDLSQLSDDEWQEFCRRIIVGYRTALVNELANAIPF